MHTAYELMKLRQNAVIYGMLAVGGYGLAVYAWVTRVEPDAVSRALAGFSLLGAIFCSVIVYVCVKNIRELTRKQNRRRF
jgi:hypothetical protein